jgi:CheY-like chemotaxis protein
VLLVEDSFGDAMLAREAFDAAPMLVNLSVAVSGEEALAWLAPQPPNSDYPIACRPEPDLILLDLSLPQMDGKAVLKAIKANPETRAIPVIVLTGSSADHDVQDCYVHGANSYIVKPLHFERLQEIVKAIECFWFDAASSPPRVSMGSSHAA